MRATWLAVLALSLVTAWVASASRQAPHPNDLSRDAFVRGVALGLFASDPEWDYGPMINEIRARGATDVLVVVNAVQSNRFASDIRATPGHSPSQVNLARVLSQVHEAGLRVALMPVVRLAARQPHEWRGVIAPADGLDAWFAAYRAFVLPLARAAEAKGVERFVVGSELSSLEPYDTRWRALIAEVRAEFSGTLTYSANWDHANTISFWDALDEVGLTAYFPLVEGAVDSELSLASAWRAPRGEIERLRTRFDKPLLITEVGYPSRGSAATRPWDDTVSAPLDLAGQKLLYRGFCDAFFETPSISGFYVWNWFGVGGPRDAGFTPRGKPAAAELERCFTRQWSKRSATGDRS